MSPWAPRTAHVPSIRSKPQICDDTRTHLRTPALPFGTVAPGGPGVGPGAVPGPAARTRHHAWARMPLTSNHSAMQDPLLACLVIRSPGIPLVPLGLLHRAWGGAGSPPRNCQAQPIRSRPRSLVWRSMPCTLSTGQIWEDAGSGEAERVLALCLAGGARLRGGRPGHRLHGVPAYEISLLFVGWDRLGGTPTTSTILEFESEKSRKILRMPVLALAFVCTIEY